MKEPKPSLVVGVGASAGGLDAFKQLLGALPSDSGMAFLLVQHLDPTHKSLLSELLSPCTRMEVHNADQGVKIRRDAVYIIRPDTALAVRKGRIENSEPTLHRGVRLPVDHLFRSLAAEYGSRAVGIVLSGAGHDGSSGVRSIKAKGGLILAQDPEDSEHSGMPQSAIDTGMVDLVLPIEEMPRALERFASLPDSVPLEIPAQGQEKAEQRSEVLTELSTQDMAQVTALLEAHANFDISVYKQPTVERRLLRRLFLGGFENVDAYLNHLRTEPLERAALVRDLLISVTEFFRDPEVFVTLREMVIDPLVSLASPGSTLRVWVPGCATGEEAYSVGMEFLDSIESQSKRLSLQIFATDIDQDALAHARAANYPHSIGERVSEQRLKRYFRALDASGYEARSTLRDVVSFAVHDLTKDPPFSRMHLISCRNVLIYLTTQAQSHVLQALHFALEANGHLLLSNSETIGPKRDLFATISKRDRIYKKIGKSSLFNVRNSRSRSLPTERTRASEAVPQGVGEARPSQNTELARRAALEACMPPTVVVSGTDAVIYSHGELGRFLSLPHDEAPRLELFALLRPEIATRTRAALYKCRRQGEAVTALFTPEDPSKSKVQIRAFPARGLSEDAVVLAFEELVSQPATPGPKDSPEQEVVIEQLEKELSATREDLRTTVEELETSNEELRSSNEESMSMNEELQSANEELEATTEELRSLNEELTTVNSQLREKVELLEQAHDDLQNFFASTKIATVFLDDELRIKRFTPTARELLGIDYGDTGRLVSDIARELLQEDLEAIAREVLESLTSRSEDIRTRDGRWINRSVLPYRTESRRIEGVVITFTDISALKETTRRLQLRERQQSVIANLGIQALRETDLHAFMDQALRAIINTIDAEFACVLELQPGNKRLLLREGVGWKDDWVGKTTEDAGAVSPGGYALQTLEPVVVEDLSSDRRFTVPELLKQHGVASGIACPIAYGNYRYGALCVFTQAPRKYSDTDVQFMLSVTNVVSWAVARYQGRMRLSLELGVAQVLTDATDVNEALDRLLDRISNELGSSLVAELWLLDEGTSLVRRGFHVAPPEDASRVERLFDTDRIEPGQGFVGRVLEDQRAHWMSDLGNPELFSITRSAKELGLLSGLGIPIRSGNKTQGVVSLFSSERIIADDEYLHSLESIGRTIGDFISRWEADDAARQLAAITSASQDSILTYKLDGTITHWLAGAERLFGYSAAEMIGKSMDRIVPEEGREELRGINERIRHGEVVDPFETTRIHKNGKRLDVSVRSSGLRNRSGQVEAISSTDRDISHLKVTEQRLVEAAKQKDEFIAMLGHELRNPLAALRGAAQVLASDPDKKRATEEATPILLRQSAHMATVLNGLLDLSRMLYGKLTYASEHVDLSAVCREVCEDSQQIAGTRIAIQAELPTTAVWILGDRVRLTQVVDNIVSNALKFSDDGGSITIRLKSTKGKAILSVQDRGAGIAPELLSSIFEPFRQAEQSVDRSKGGLGLGLAIAKSIVEHHGGQLRAISEGEGKGSEFVIELPVAKKKPARSVASSSPKMAAKKVLIIEDKVDNARMLRRVLELDGHVVAIAHLGEDGFALAKEQRPDVVLCDLGLPGKMTGFDVARAIRAHAAIADTRLIAVSGYGRPEDVERGREAGFDAHLTKPIDPDLLESLLSDDEVDAAHE